MNQKLFPPNSSYVFQIIFFQLDICLKFLNDLKQCFAYHLASVKTFDIQVDQNFLYNVVKSLICENIFKHFLLCSDLSSGFVKMKWGYLTLSDMVIQVPDDHLTEGRLQNKKPGMTKPALSVLIPKKGNPPQMPFFYIFYTDSTKYGEHFGV